MTTEPKPAGDEKEDVDRLDEARDWTDPRGAGVAAIEGPMLDKAVVLAAQSMDLDEADLALGVELARLRLQHYRDAVAYRIRQPAGVANQFLAILAQSQRCL